MTEGMLQLGTVLLAAFGVLRVWQIFRYIVEQFT